MILLCLLLGAQTLDGGKVRHLGIEGSPEWEEFAGRTPDAARLELEFDGKASASEGTLFIRQENVKYRWEVALNGKRLGRLSPQETPLVLTLALPAGTLRDGKNTLTIVPRSKDPDDIRVGPIRIDPRPPAEAVAQATLEIGVSEPGRDGPLPCRITVTDAGGALAPILPAPDQRLAIRPGVAYTADGRATLRVPPGTYAVHATRGPEYGLDRREVEVAAGETKRLSLSIRREVDTRGWVACDTHLHTLELSGHGDASVRERMLTLAGEGIELAIATEHNQHADYAAAAKEAGVDGFLTTVRGNEVTTKTGHFNVFPVRSGSALPDHGLSKWTELVEDIRGKTGAEVIILNHPCDVHSGFTPFAPENLHPATGRNLRGPDYTFNAVELVNSGALRSDLMEPYRAWFSILNRGVRLTGVGSSDSHDVDRFIAGQGRTYIRCDDDDPSRIDVGKAARALAEGRALVSLGLWTTLEVDGRFGPGDLVTGSGERMTLAAEVRSPAWITADRVDVYLGGGPHPVWSEAVGGGASRAEISLPRPRRDTWLVAVATGPGPREPHWPIPRPYQANVRKWTPRVLGSSNPVWIDADGDGKYTSPRDYAKRLIEEHGKDAAALARALSDGYDEIVAAHVAELCMTLGIDLSGQFRRVPDHIRRGFAAYLQGVRKR